MWGSAAFESGDEMATNKPRVSVTLDPETYEVLRELAAQNRQSLSAVIGELLDAVAPTVYRVVEAGRRYQALSEGMRDQVRGTFTAAEAKIAPVLRDLEKQAFAALEAVDEAEQDPRPVTRGSRPPLSMVPPAESGSST